MPYVMSDCRDIKRKYISFPQNACPRRSLNLRINVPSPPRIRLRDMQNRNRRYDTRNPQINVGRLKYIEGMLEVVVTVRSTIRRSQM